jgi:hypothetical protein
MIPRHYKAPGFQDPGQPLYCLVAANGCFLVRRNELFTSVTEAPVPGLEEQSPSLKLHFGKVPRAVLESIYGFFDWAWREWDAEAIVCLYYDPLERRFVVEVPPQKLFRYRGWGRWHTERRLEYSAAPRPAGYLKLGDAHSHADMPAFFSAADDRDDREDGLRIVMGDLDRASPSVRVSFVAGGTRFHLRPEDALEEFAQPTPPAADWLRQVTCEYEGLPENAKGGKCQGFKGGNSR